MTTRVLFFAEPATAAHVARPVVLARGLAQEGYDVSLATGPDFRRLAQDANLPVHDLWAIGTRAYLAAVAAGRPVFPYDVLERYASDDARLIAHVRPDVIVGDFRLSLAVSARLARIPYFAISNAYWSPYAAVRFPVPVHPATRLLGVGVCERAFRLLEPMILAHHAKPMQRLRRQHGMPPITHGLRGIFTDGDVTLFADVPQMVPLGGEWHPDRHVFLGPVVWSPHLPMPPDLHGGSDVRPLVYVSLGSSGDPALLHAIVTAVRALGWRAAVATGNMPCDLPSSRDVFVRAWLPGSELATIAQLVICNGGSPATHQALQAGTPVLGIPANLDQLLNMHFVVATGAGLAIRADRVNTRRIRDAVQRLVTDPRFRQRATQVQGWLGACAPTPTLVGAIERALTR